MAIAVFGIILVAGFGVAGLLAFVWYVYAQAQERKAEVAVRFSGLTVLLQENNASFFGRQSAGKTQMRGSGVLVLTPNELYFKMWLPAKELRIPIKSITGIESPSSFLGKSRFTPLLQVNFQNSAGQVDAAAWQVVNLSEWQRHLEQLAGSGK
jgi:hypothetical protein